MVEEFLCGDVSKIVLWKIMADSNNYLVSNSAMRKKVRPVLLIKTK